MDSLSETKICSKCKIAKPILEFGKYSASKDGLRHNCKECRNFKEAEYRASNWEDIYKRKKESRDRNIDSSRASARKYYYKTREKYLEEHREKYSSDEEFRAIKRLRNKKWRKENPEKNARKTMRRYAKKKGSTSESYSYEDVLKVWGTNCHICDKPINLSAPRNCRGFDWENGLHVDHVIPINSGGPDILDNVRPAHALCNIKKSCR